MPEDIKEEVTEEVAEKVEKKKGPLGKLKVLYFQMQKNKQQSSVQLSELPFLAGLGLS